MAGSECEYSCRNIIYYTYLAHAPVQIEEKCTVDLKKKNNNPDT